MKKSCVISLLLASSVLAVQEEEGSASVCNALAMSGGGSRGSYEAGAVWGMYYSGEDKKKFEYDVITGVSAGAINAVAMGVFPKEQTEKGIQEMSDRWANLAQSNLYEQWGPLREVGGITLHDGVYNTAPLAEYIGDFVKLNGGKLKRRVNVLAVDANSGSAISYSEKTTDPVKAVLSSAAIPFVFPSIEWGGNVAIDGGSVFAVDLATAIKRCREVVSSDSKINLDIVTIHNMNTLEAWKETKNTMGNWLRYEDVKARYNHDADILRFRQAYP